MALSQYREFAEKVSSSFAAIQNKYPKEFQCKQACHECCQPNLSVNALERDAIREFLLANPQRVEALRTTAKQGPFKGKRCSLLSAEGACLIYEARPVVCRSHGAPLQFKDPGTKNPDKAERFRDVCPLNFKAISLGELPAEDVLNLDTINTLLSLLARQNLSKEQLEQRFALELEQLL